MEEMELYNWLVMEEMELYNWLVMEEMELYNWLVMELYNWLVMEMELYNWLVMEEMVNVCNKVSPNISEDHLLKLTDKALEYVRCGVTCQPVELYNFFKSNRIYTDYLNLIKKSGSEAVDIRACPLKTKGGGGGGGRHSLK